MSRDTRPFIFLGIALVVSAIITGLLAQGMDSEAFWTNVSTELIGAVVTVVIVGLIFRWTDSSKLKDANNHVRRSLGALALKMVSVITEGLGLAYDVAPPEEPDPEHNGGLAQHAVTLEKEEIASGLVRLDDSEVANFANSLELLQKSFQTFYDRSFETLDENWGVDLLVLVETLDYWADEIRVMATIETEVEKSYADEPADEFKDASIHQAVGEVKDMYGSEFAPRLHDLILTGVSIAQKTGVISVPDYFVGLKKILTKMESG